MIVDEKPVALFDMDGTLCNYHDKLMADMKLLAAPGEEEYANLYDESKPWLKARMDLIKSQPGWWLNLEPLQLGMVLYDLIRLLDFEVEIATKGPRTKRRAWMEKGEWVDEHLGADIPINVLGKNKSRYYGHVLVEDFPEYLLGWLEHRPRGLGILIHNESNADFNHPNVIRTDGANILDVKHHLLAVKKRKPGQHWRECL
jgi:aromatic ring-cleaving dioxygenase